MLYAIYGLGNVFAYANNGGHNYVYPNGTNEWRMGIDKQGSQHYLKLKVSDSAAGMILDKLFLQGAENALKYL